MTEKIVDKISKLLAKAESTNGHEAEALTERAEELMIKYGIEQAMLDRHDSSRVGSEKIVQEPLETRGIYRSVLHDFASMILYALDLRGVQVTSGAKSNTKILYVIGFESDVKNALQLMSSLQLQALSAMKTWWSDGGGDTYIRMFGSDGDRYKEREFFIQAFGFAAYERIYATRKRVVEEVVSSSGAGTELALRDRSSALDDYMSDKFGDLGPGRTNLRSGGSDSAARAGIAAGQTADIGQTRVGARKSLR